MARLPRLTKRGWAVAGIALGLYFFANQTQVGWLYVLSALAAGLLLVCAPLPGAMLRGLSLIRRVDGATGAAVELYAGRPVALHLEWRQPGRVPALLLQAGDTYGFAAAGERAQTLFVPHVPARGVTSLHFNLSAARRGWHPLGPAQVSTRAPFGLFAAERAVPAAGPAGVLVFPEYREIKQLALLDRQLAVEHSQTRPGAAGEFVGVREHRPSDPRRHIHWRSTAKTGRLIVKEFADERQPGLTIALDLRAASALGSADDNTLELAIKVAASLAHYAHARGLPVSLVTNSRQWPAPSGALSWWGLMSYLARVQPEGELSLVASLLGATLTRSLAVVMPAPDVEAAAACIALKQAGQEVLAAVVDPGPFAWVEGARQAAQLVVGMQSAGVVALLIASAWEEALAEA